MQFKPPFESAMKFWQLGAPGEFFSVDDVF
jgi:hypothetical protein